MAPNKKLASWGWSASVFAAEYTGGRKTPNPTEFSGYSMTISVNAYGMIGYYSSSATYGLANGARYAPGYSLIGVGVSSPGLGISHEVNNTFYMNYFKVNN